MNLKSNEIRKRFFSFMKERGHVIVESQSLLPMDDPTTLFTGSGMQPMLPYLLGEKHPKGNKIADIQKCFRAGEIEEVGDNRHTTSFEMVGNWSFGDYFKNEQIDWIFEFLTDKEKGLGLDPKRLYITAFLGDQENGLKKDTEAGKKWKEVFSKVGIDAKEVDMGSANDGAKKGMGDGKIFYYDAKENWWSRAGIPDNMPIGEPGGPDSEMFYDYGEFIQHDEKYGKYCHPACDCGRFVEIGNNVFMNYKKIADGVFEELPKKNIDHGSGLERWAAAVNNQNDIFKTDIFEELILVIEKSSGKKYDNLDFQNNFRIIMDHIKSAVLMMGDGLAPSNKDAGYILRRLIRRALVNMKNIDFDFQDTPKIIRAVENTYGEVYDNILENKDFIQKELMGEILKFEKTLTAGMKEFKKIINPEYKNNHIQKLEFGMCETAGCALNEISGEDAFKLFASYGFPFELIDEEAKKEGFVVDKKDFDEKMKEHSKKSKTASAGKFKGGMGGDSEKITAFHTITHLLLAALKKFVGEHVSQKGSNITDERARFDFNNDEKVQKDVQEKIENWINEVVEKGAEVKTEEMNKVDAEKDESITGSFWEKYPDIVKVWIIEKDGEIFSRELCNGPHVKNTADIKKFGRVKIKKEESSSAGVRRIKLIFVEK